MFPIFRNTILFVLLTGGLALQVWATGVSAHRPGAMGHWQLRNAATVMAEATTFSNIQGFNFNMVGQVPLSKTTNTHLAESTAGAAYNTGQHLGNKKAIKAELLTDLLTILNNPANYGNAQPSGKFEPHLGFIFLDKSGNVVLEVSISLLNNAVQASPRLAYYTQKQLNPQGIQKIKALCQASGITAVTPEYAARYTPENLNTTQKQGLLAQAINPDLFRDKRPIADNSGNSNTPGEGNTGIPQHTEGDSSTQDNTQTPPPRDPVEDDVVAIDNVVTDVVNDFAMEDEFSEEIGTEFDDLEADADLFAEEESFSDLDDEAFEDFNEDFSSDDFTLEDDFEDFEDDLGDFDEDFAMEDEFDDFADDDLEEFSDFDDMEDDFDFDF